MADYNPTPNVLPAAVDIVDDGGPREAAEVNLPVETALDAIKYLQDRWNLITAPTFSSNGSPGNQAGVETLASGGESTTVKLVIPGLQAGDIVWISGTLSVDDLNDVDHILSLFETNNSLVLSGWHWIVRDHSGSHDAQSVSVSLMVTVGGSHTGEWDIRVKQNASGQDLNLTAVWNLSALVLRP